MSVANAYVLPKENGSCRQAVVSGKPLAFKKSYLIDSVPLNGHRYLQDHRVAGKVIYPAAGFCIAGIAVHRALRSPDDHHKPLVLENLKFRRPLSLSDHQSRVLRLRYKPQRSEFTVLSDRDDDQFAVTPHAIGHLGGTVADVPDCDRNFDALLMRCSQRIDVADFYRRFRQSGLDYGPYFKRIVDAYISRQSGEALTCISTHAELRGTGHQQARHITVLDGAFQSLAAAVGQDHFNLYIPSRIRTMHVFGEFESNVWCHVELTSMTNRAVTGNIKVLNSEKRPLMIIRGLSCLKVSRSQIAGCNAALNQQDRSSLNNNNLPQALSSAGLRN